MKSNRRSSTSIPPQPPRLSDGNFPGKLSEEVARGAHLTGFLFSTALDTGRLEHPSDISTLIAPPQNPNLFGGNIVIGMGPEFH